MTVQISRDFLDPFGYLAFDSASGEILAHGGTAFKALQIADLSHPMSSIRVIVAGKAGARIWDARMSYARACIVVDSR